MDKKIMKEIDEILNRQWPEVKPTTDPDNPQLPYNICHIDNEFCQHQKRCTGCEKYNKWLKDHYRRG